MLKGSPGLNFINVVRVWIFINVVRVRILSRIESRSGFYWCSPGPGPDYINQSPGVSPYVFVFRLRILSIFQSGSGFYQASPGPSASPDFIQFESRFGSGFYQACPGPGPGPDSTNTLQMYINKFVGYLLDQCDIIRTIMAICDENYSPFLITTNL